MKTRLKIAKFILTMLVLYGAKLVFCNPYWTIESTLGLWLAIICGAGLIITIFSDVPESKFE